MTQYARLQGELTLLNEMLAPKYLETLIERQEQDIAELRRLALEHEEQFGQFVP